MASNATSISSTIPSLPIESDETNYLDWEVQIMTLMQYHHLWNIVKGIKTSPKATFIVSSSTTTQAAIDAWINKDGHTHTFMLFNTKPKLLINFLAKMTRQPKTCGCSPAKVS